METISINDKLNQKALADQMSAEAQTNQTLSRVLGLVSSMAETACGSKVAGLTGMMSQGLGMFSKKL